MRILNTESTFFQILTGVSIPLSITFGLAIAGWLITSSIERSKLDAEYVKIALGILIDEKNGHDVKVDKSNTKPSDGEIALRKWAVRLLNDKSPVKFSDDEKTALINEGLKFTIISLIKHSENPQSEPMSKGVAKLMTGGAITEMKDSSDNSKIKNKDNSNEFKEFKVDF